MSTVRPLTLIVAAALTLLACGGPGPSTDSASEVAPSYGGTAIVGVGSDFDVFNELATTSALGDQFIGHVLFQNLLVYDENLDYAPALADSFLQIVHDEQPYVFLIADHERWGASRRLRGVEPAAAPNAYAPLASIARWWIPPANR